MTNKLSISEKWEKRAQVSRATDG